MLAPGFFEWAELHRLTLITWLPFRTSRWPSCSWRGGRGGVPTMVGGCPRCLDARARPFVRRLPNRMDRTVCGVALAFERRSRPPPAFANPLYSLLRDYGRRCLTELISPTSAQTRRAVVGGSCVRGRAVPLSAHAVLGGVPPLYRGLRQAPLTGLLEIRPASRWRLELGDFSARTEFISRTRKTVIGGLLSRVRAAG